MGKEQNVMGKHGAFTVSKIFGLVGQCICISSPSLGSGSQHNLGSSLSSFVFVLDNGVFVCVLDCALLLS